MSAHRVEMVLRNSERNRKIEALGRLSKGLGGKADGEHKPLIASINLRASRNDRASQAGLPGSGVVSLSKECRTNSYLVRHFPFNGSREGFSADDFPDAQCQPIAFTPKFCH